VLFVVLCDVWFRILPRCSLISYWKISISQLQIQPMIWASTLKIWKHVNFVDLGFIILFIGILLFYVINLDAVSLFADSPFTFLAMFVSDVIYWFNLNELISFYFCQKNKKIKPEICDVIPNHHLNLNLNIVTSRSCFIFFFIFWIQNSLPKLTLRRIEYKILGGTHFKVLNQHQPKWVAALFSYL